MIFDTSSSVLHDQMLQIDVKLSWIDMEAHRWVNSHL